MRKKKSDSCDEKAVSKVGMLKFEVWEIMGKNQNKCERLGRI